MPVIASRTEKAILAEMGEARGRVRAVAAGRESLLAAPIPPTLVNLRRSPHEVAPDLIGAELTSPASAA